MSEGQRCKKVKFKEGVPQRCRIQDDSRPMEKFPAVLGILMVIMLFMMFMQLVYSGLHYPCARAASVWVEETTKFGTKLFELPKKQKPPDLIRELDEDLLFLRRDTVTAYGLTADTVLDTNALTDDELDQLWSVLVQTPQCLHAADRFDIIFDTGTTVLVSYERSDFVMLRVRFSKTVNSLDLSNRSIADRTQQSAIKLFES